MADKSEQTGRVFVVLAALVAVGLLVSWLVSGPPRRDYPDRIPVRFWHMWTANWKVVIEDICDRFNESQDKYEIIPLSVPGTAADSKFLLAVAGGDPPDCMAQWNQVIPRWSESNIIIPLDELMTETEWRTFQETTYPIAKRIGMYKGHLYGVTTGMNIWACYYRTDFFREAGLDPDIFPDTLEKLVELGRKMHHVDEYGNLVRIGYLPQWLNLYAPVFGQGFYDYANDKLTISTPQNLRAMQFLAGERERIGFDKVVAFESSQATTFGASWPFITGSFCIALDGQWRIQQLRQFAPEVEYRTAPLPPPKGGRRHAGWSNGNFMVIPRGAKQVEGAWEFIKFWSGIEKPERAAEFATWGGWLPLNADVVNAPLYQKYVQENPEFQTFLDMLPSTNIVASPPVAGPSRG